MVCYLEVRSVPTGAKVYIDGKLAGTTNFNNYRINPGRYRIQIKKEGYEDWENSSYEIKTSDLLKYIIANLKTEGEKTGDIKFQSTPTGAKVYLNDDYKGKTTLTLFSLNPLLVGLIAGLGAAIGEFTGYGLGLGGRKVIEKKYKKDIEKVEKLFQRYGGFLIIVLFAATPLPDDIVGLLGGTLRYSLKKFFIASLIGKIILNLALAYAGFYGLNWILSVLFLFP